MSIPGNKKTLTFTMMVAMSMLWACSGDDGATGATGATGPAGPPGPPGPPADTSIVIGDGGDLTADEIETLGKLQATITGVTVSSPPVVDFTVLDSAGNPAVGLAAGTVRFTFVKLVPGDPDFNGGLPYWQNYLNRESTADLPNPVLVTAIQATNDRNGSLEELGNGQYRYTFATDVTNVTDPIAIGWEPNLTHRVAMEIRLDRDSGARRAMAPDNPFFDFVPDGGAGSGVTKVIVDTNNCENCHFEFAEHGGQRKTVEYCVTCHNPGSVDPNSGESVDMAYLAHSIHMGHDRAVPYIVDGDDFSMVHYPQAQTYCETCHTASATHPDGDNWNEQASAKACGGCHADGLVAQDFDPVTGQAEYFFDHTLAEADVDVGIVEDGACAACHLGVISTAGPPLAIHSRIRGDDRARAAAGDNFVFEILSATATGPGQAPVVTFRISDPQGGAYDIFNDPEFTDGNASLNLYVQWSTADYYGGDENGLVHGARQNDDLSIQAVQDLNFRDTGYPYRMRIDSIRNAITNGGSTNADGSYTLTFFRALPDAFTGDIVVGLGGHPAWEYEDQDLVTAFDRAAAVSAVFFAGEPRVAAFDSAQCSACHQRLMEHGANRNGNAEFCLMCHNGDAAVCQSNPDPDGSCPDGQTNEGYHFGYLIHSIHTGSTTFQTDSGGDWSDVHFPQNVANCETCHKPGAYNVARATARAVSTRQGNDVRVWTDDTATTPTAAACGVCHTSTAAKGHFESQSGQVDDLKCTIVGASCGAADGSSGSGLPNGQEACAVCHGTGAQFETSQYHNPGVE